MIVASPGSGKTTRVAEAIAETLSGLVLCVEPRRLACIGAAQRVSSERDECVGDFVGYHVRLDRVVGKQTRLIYLTTGMLLQYLSANPFLDGVSAVIFDEFHERSLANDVGLALCRHLQVEAGVELKLLVMSATLQPEAIGDYLGHCACFTLDQASHPLTVRHLSTPPGLRFLDYGEALIDALGEALASQSGDCLVFLPSYYELSESRRLAQARFGDAYDYLLCYGSQSITDQTAVLQPSRGKRRVIFATNIAESSLTIAGVDAVIDAGLAKRPFFDSVSGLSRLELGRISRASADQRAGRAARQGPGLCLRLWSPATHARLDANARPDIEQGDLSDALLQIYAWGLETPDKLSFFTPPAKGRLRDARVLLASLGAIENDEITTLGKRMSKLPLSSRLARWMLASIAYDCLWDAALLACYLSEAPYRRGASDQWPGPDLWQDLESLKARKHAWEVAPIYKLANELVKSLESLQIEGSKLEGSDGDETSKSAMALTLSSQERLAKAMLCAYGDRLAQVRPDKNPKLTASDPARGMQSIFARTQHSKGLVLRESGRLRDAQFFIAADLDLSKSTAQASNPVLKALLIDKNWLDWKTGLVARYEADKERVVVAEALCHGNFTLREVFVYGKEYDALVRQTLLEAAIADPEQALNLKSDATQSLGDRLTFLKRYNASYDWPDLSLEACAAYLPQIVKKQENFAALRTFNLAQFILDRMSYEQRSLLDRLAPTHVTLENGRRVAVDYSQDPPIVSVKIQDAFGTWTLPRLIDNAIPVIMHLLAPSRRPVQVTQDLESFWNNTYPELRKVLRGRYPKHDWPDDPRNPPQPREYKPRK